MSAKAVTGDEGAAREAALRAMQEAAESSSAESRVPKGPKGTRGIVMLSNDISWTSPDDHHHHHHGATMHNTSSGNRGGYDDAKLRFYESSTVDLFNGWRSSDLPTAHGHCSAPPTPCVPRACIADVKLASASASAYRRSRGVEHAFDLTGWREPPLIGVERADPPASTDRRVGRARSRARCDECL